MGSPIVQPLVDWRDKIAEFNDHPLDSLEGLLGIKHATPAPAMAPGTSETNPGTLPPQWEQANLIARQQNADADAKAAQDAALKQKFAAATAARQPQGR